MTEPRPRPGLPGVVDRLIGPDATRTEWLLNGVPALVAAALAPVYAYALEPGWTLLQYLVAALLAFDIVGGVVTHATASGRRWYHRPQVGAKGQFAFVALHLLHLALVSWLFLGWDAAWLSAAAGWLLFAALAVLGSPAYLRRPLAMLGCAVGLLLALIVLPQPMGLEWFLPLFYLKLLGSHLSGV